MSKKPVDPRTLGQHPQAVIYARVSSKEQEKEGYSIPAQIKLLRDHASVHGLQIVREFTDVETAKKAGRKQFGEMVAFLSKRTTCRIILVEKTDRLYRNIKDWVSLDELTHNLEAMNGGVITEKLELGGDGVALFLLLL